MKLKQEISPGIYEGVAFADYCAWDAVNSSSLKQMDVSAAHCKYALDGLDSFDSGSLKFGRLAHTGQLEPDQLKHSYVVMPDFASDPANVTASGSRPASPRATAWYKAKVAEFEEAENAIGREVVSQEAYDKMRRVLQSIKDNPEADRVLNSPGQSELSICWICPHTGVKCKARIDRKPDGLNLIADLKTCTPIHAFDFELWSRRYHWQAAFYRTGWETLTDTRPDFWFVVVGPPDSELLTCLAAPVSSDLLDIGFDKCLELLGKVAYCHTQGEWPNLEQPAQWTGPKYKVEQALNKEVEWNE